MNLEKTLREIVETQMNLFGLNQNRASYKLHQVYSSNLIHAINGEIFELPKGVERISICYRNSINNCLNDRDFMYYDNVLIPLGTHIYSEKFSHSVYFLDNEFNCENSIKLSEFII